MEYWQGVMNWPIVNDWVCEICGDYTGMTWGIVHAECRCDKCHAQYYMRDGTEENKITNQPKCEIKDEWMEPLKRAYAKFQRPIDELVGEFGKSLLEQ